MNELWLSFFQLDFFIESRCVNCMNGLVLWHFLFQSCILRCSSPVFTCARTACVFICDVQGFYCIGFSTVDECYFDFGFCVSPWIRIYFVYTVGSNTRWNELFNQRLYNWDRCNPKIYYFRMGSNWAILNGLGQIELIRILPNLQLWKWIDPCMCWK